MGFSTDKATEMAPFEVPHGSRRHLTPAPAPALSERAVVPVVAAVTAGLLAEEPFEALVLTLLAFACAAFVVPGVRGRRCFRSCAPRSSCCAR